MATLETRDLVIDIPGRADGRPLSLRLAPGQRWGILGPNGAGKTTLLHTLAGLQPPRSGNIYLDGAPWRTTNARRWPGAWRWCSRSARTASRPRCWKPP